MQESDVRRQLREEKKRNLVRWFYRERNKYVLGSSDVHHGSEAARRRRQIRAGQLSGGHFSQKYRIWMPFVTDAARENARA